MCKRHKRFVIFLDVDGVLNTTTTVRKPRMDIRGLMMHEWEVLAKTIEKLEEQILFYLPTGKR